MQGSYYVCMQGSYYASISDPMETKLRGDLKTLMFEVGGVAAISFSVDVLRSLLRLHNVSSFRQYNNCSHRDICVDRDSVSLQPTNHQDQSYTLKHSWLRNKLMSIIHRIM